MICLLSRTVFGISECICIIQNTLLCMWFNNDEIPLALALVACMTKLSRGTSDNLAAIVYNQHRDITQFFYMGLAVSAISIISAFAIVHFLMKVIEAHDRTAAGKDQY